MGPEDPEAWWRTSDDLDARCRDPECVECRGLDEDAAADALMAEREALREEER